MQPSNRDPISPVSVIAVWLMALGIFALRARSGAEWVRIIDDANLVFHEAGHPIFGILWKPLWVYGGTVMQLAIPGAVAYQFRRSRQPASFAVALIWFFENFLNIGRYMSDARAQLLPLVGGGEHDWTTIFTQWGVLPYDTRIGGFIVFLGGLGMLGACVWLTLDWKSSRNSVI